MDNVTIVFCEGMHDINFLSKILFVHGFKDYKKKLNDFKEPLGEQYLSILREEKNLESKKIGFNSIYKVPSVALFGKNEHLVLFHNMGGDERQSERAEVLSMYQNIQKDDNKDKDEFTADYKLNFRFLYFFDADDNKLRPLHEVSFFKLI